MLYLYTSIMQGGHYYITSIQLHKLSCGNQTAESVSSKVKFQSGDSSHMAGCLSDKFLHPATKLIKLNLFLTTVS